LPAQTHQEAGGQLSCPSGGWWQWQIRGRLFQWRLRVQKGGEAPAVSYPNCGKPNKPTIWMVIPKLILVITTLDPRLPEEEWLMNLGCCILSLRMKHRTELLPEAGLGREHTLLQSIMG
jgi:hypothetical protein